MQQQQQQRSVMHRGAHNLASLLLIKLVAVVVGADAVGQDEGDECNK